MMDLDEALSRLAKFEPPTSLDGIEHRVLLRIAQERGSRSPPAGSGALTIATALVMGIVGGTLPNPSEPTLSLYPLDGGAALAPSSLLAAAE